MNKVAVLVSALAGAVGALPATAAHWSATPAIAWTVDHQSNRNLASDERATQGASVNLDVLLRRATEVSDISVRPRAQLQRYSDNTVADATNASLAIASSWHDEIDSLGMRAVVSRENTLTSDLEDTGILRGDTIRKTRSMSASWDRAISASHVRQLQLSYADVDYSGDFERELPGYQYPSVSLTERFELSGRTALGVTAFGSELDSPGGTSDSRNYGAQLSLERRLTPRLFAMAALGFSKTELTEQSQDGYVAQFTLRQEMELGAWTLDYGHSVAASGRGVLVERDRASLTFDRAIAARLHAHFGLVGVRNDELGMRLSGERRSYESVETGLDWRTARTWTLGWRAGFARADQALGGQRGEGWRTSLVAWWSPRPWTMSR